MGLDLLQGVAAVTSGLPADWALRLAWLIAQAAIGVGVVGLIGAAGFLNARRREGARNRAARVRPARPIPYEAPPAPSPGWRSGTGRVGLVPPVPR